MKYLGVVIALAVSSFSLFAQTEVSAYEKAFEVVKNLETLKSCDFEKIWPGYTWANKFDSVLLVSTNNSKSFELDYKTFSMKEIPFEKTPSFALGGFAESSIGEKKYISYSLDYGDTYYDTLALLVHENFHYYGQEGIKGVPESIRATRADVYPFNPLPRLYRSMINFYLSEALKKPEQKTEFISKAKFWNNLHKTEFFDDYISVGNLDMIEGSATYAEALTIAMARNNCSLTKEATSAMLFTKPDNVYDFYTYFESDKAGQAYLGGMLAYMVDDLLFDGTLNLKKMTMEGKQPMDQLFTHFEAVETSVNEEINQSIDDDYRAINEEAKIDVDQYLENKNKGMIAISQPLRLQGDMGGSFSVNGFIAVDEAKYGFAEIYQSYKRSFETPTIKAKFTGVNLYETTENECGKEQMVYWVDEAQIKDGILSAKAEKLELTATDFEQKADMICIK